MGHAVSGSGVGAMARQTKNALIAIVGILLAAAGAQATSHVRIVRLSYTDGNVQLSKAKGQSLERAILNSPIVEGASIVTGTDGLAEVEFENNSTVRLGESTDVMFRQLLINDAGELINEVELVRGTIYFDASSGKNNVYRVIAAGRTITVPRKSQVRFLMNGDQVEVAVFSGEAQLQSNAELVKIKKNNTLTLDATNPEGFTLAKGVDSFPLDRWNNERAAYQNVYAYNNAGYGSYGSPGIGAGFGYQDLAYYGGFMFLPGYGMVWQPYGASSWLGWDPYMSGAWAFTPGFGYVWASAYPWGWLPYHYGAWNYQPVVGWFWCPGNSFNHGGVVTNWQPTAPVVNGPAGYAAPTPPVMPPNGNRPSVLVGTIGRMPAYLPGGPVPPNFRSVIQDHTGLSGMTGPMGGAQRSWGGSSMAARNSRAVNSRSINTTAPTARTFSAPEERAYGRGRFEEGGVARNNAGAGHVFAAPQPAASPAWTSDGSGAAAPSASFGRSAAAPMPRSAGAGRPGVGGTSHGSSGATPK